MRSLAANPGGSGVLMDQRLHRRGEGARRGDPASPDVGTTLRPTGHGIGGKTRGINSYSNNTSLYVRLTEVILEITGLITGAAVPLADLTGRAE